MTFSKTEHDLRCTCLGEPIIGKYGMDSSGRPYVHVKAWKQGRLIVEVVQTDGLLRVRCRKCKRWHTVAIRGRHAPTVNQEPLPKSLESEIGS